MRAAPIAVLAGLCALQAAVLAGLWIAPDGRPRDAVRWQEPAARRADYAAAGPGLPAAADAAPPGADLLARPLFSLTRRPPEPVAAAAVEPAPDRLDQVRVRAIVEGPDAVSSAILDLDGTSRRVLKHQAFEGWTLDALDTQERTVTLVRDGRRRVLALQRGRMTAADTRLRPGGARAPAPFPVPAAPAPGGAPR